MSDFALLLAPIQATQSSRTNERENKPREERPPKLQTPKTVTNTPFGRDTWRYVEFRLNYTDAGYQHILTPKKEESIIQSIIPLDGLSEPDDWEGGLSERSFVSSSTLNSALKKVDQISSSIGGFMPLRDYKNRSGAGYGMENKYGVGRGMFRISLVSYTRELTERELSTLDTKSRIYEEDSYQSHTYVSVEEIPGGEKKVVQEAKLFGYLPFLVPYATYGCVCSAWQTKQSKQFRFDPIRSFSLKRICTIKFDEELLFGHFKHMSAQELRCHNYATVYENVALKYRKCYEDYLKSYLVGGGKLSVKDYRLLKGQSISTDFPSWKDPIDSRVMNHWYKLEIGNRWLTKETVVSPALHFDDWGLSERNKRISGCNPLGPLYKLSCNRSPNTVWGVVVEFKVFFEFFPLLSDFLFGLCLYSRYYGLSSTTEEFSVLKELRRIKQVLEGPECWKFCFETETLKLSPRLFGSLILTEEGTPFPFDFLGINDLSEENKLVLEMALGSSKNKWLSVAMRCQKGIMKERMENNVSRDIGSLYGELALNIIDHLSKKMKTTKNTGFSVGGSAYGIAFQLKVEEEEVKKAFTRLKKEKMMLVSTRRSLIGLGQSMGLKRAECLRLIGSISLPGGMCSLRKYHLNEERIVQSMLRIMKRHTRNKNLAWGDPELVNDLHGFDRLTSSQKACVWATFEVPFLCIVGLPGTGKTEALKYIYKVHSKLGPNSVAVGTYGGCMSCKLKKKGLISANTIHDAIHQKKLLDKLFSTPDDVDVEEKGERLEEWLWYQEVRTFVWDEFSNSPDQLISELLSEDVFPNLERVVFVFDPIQTAPLEEGQMSMALMNSMYKMTESHKKSLVLKYETNEGETIPEGSLPKMGMVALLIGNHRFTDARGHISQNDGVLLSGSKLMIRELKFKRTSLLSLGNRCSLNRMFDAWLEYCRLDILFGLSDAEIASHMTVSWSLGADVSFTDEPNLAITSIGSMEGMEIRSKLKLKITEIVQKYEKSVLETTGGQEWSCLNVDLDFIPDLDISDTSYTLFGVSNFAVDKGMVGTHPRSLLYIERLKSLKAMSTNILGNKLIKYLFSNVFYDFRRIVLVANAICSDSNNTALVSMEDNQLLALTKRECKLVNSICEELLVLNVLLWGSNDLLQKFGFTGLRVGVRRAKGGYFLGQRLVIKQNKFKQSKNESRLVSREFSDVKRYIKYIESEREKKLAGIEEEPAEDTPSFKVSCNNQDVTEVLCIPKVSNGEFFYFLGHCSYWEQCITSDSVWLLIRLKMFIMDTLFSIYEMTFSLLASNNFSSCLVKGKVFPEETPSSTGFNEPRDFPPTNLLEDVERLEESCSKNIQVYKEDRFNHYSWLLGRVGKDRINKRANKVEFEKILELLNADEKTIDEAVSPIVKTLESNAYKTLNNNRWMNHENLGFECPLNGNRTWVIAAEPSFWLRALYWYRGSNPKRRFEQKLLERIEEVSYFIGVKRSDHAALLDPEFVSQKLGELCSNQFWTPPGLYDNFKSASCPVFNNQGPVLPKVPTYGDLWPIGRSNSNLTTKSWRGWLSKGIVNRRDGRTPTMMIPPGHKARELFVVTKNLETGYKDATCIPVKIETGGGGDYPKDLSLDYIMSGWCVTADSSQGGEFQKVGLVMPKTSFGTGPNKVKKNNISTIYNGFGLSNVHVSLTRTKEQFVLFGKLEDFVALAQKGSELKRRDPSPLQYKLKMIYELMQVKGEEETVS